MTREETCGQNYCYLPKGHDGLHKAKARIYDIGEEVYHRTHEVTCPHCNEVFIGDTPSYVVKGLSH